MGRSERTARRVLQRLITRGHVSKAGTKGRHANTYTLLASMPNGSNLDIHDRVNNVDIFVRVEEAKSPSTRTSMSANVDTGDLVNPDTGVPSTTYTSSNSSSSFNSNDRKDREPIREAVVAPLSGGAPPANDMAEGNRSLEWLELEMEEKGVRELSSLSARELESVARYFGLEFTTAHAEENSIIVFGQRNVSHIASIAERHSSLTLRELLYEAELMCDDGIESDFDFAVFDKWLRANEAA
jgi:hypothetical protein